MLRATVAFTLDEQLLEQLFARPQTDELDIDVPLHLQPGQFDQVTGQIDNPDRLAHVQDEDLAAGAQRSGLKHQLDRFGDGHKKAAHVWMGDSHRPAGLDLLFEGQHHAAPAAQDIAEAHSHVGLAAGFGRPMHQQLSGPLAGPHDAGGVDRLVGGDHHEVLDTGRQGSPQHIASAQHVVGDRLARVLLHQRHMFVSGRVKDNLRPVLIEDRLNALGETNIGNDGLDRDLRQKIGNLRAGIVPVLLLTPGL